MVQFLNDGGMDQVLRKTSSAPECLGAQEEIQRENPELQNVSGCQDLKRLIAMKSCPILNRNISKPPRYSPPKKGTIRQIRKSLVPNGSSRRQLLSHTNKAQSYNGKELQRAEEDAMLNRFYSSPEVYEPEVQSDEEVPEDDPELMLRVLTLKGLFSASITSRPDKALTTAKSWARAAHLFKEKKEYEKAIICERYNIKIRLKVLGHEHPQTATSIAKFASYKMALGDYRAAYKHFSRAEKILKAHTQENGGAEGIEVGPAAYHNGMYEVALDHYRSEGLEGNVEQAVLTNNLGAIFVALYDLSKADQSLQLALDQHLAQHEKNSEMRGAILLNTASFLFHKGEIQDSLVNLQGAKSAFEKAFGEKHPSVATCLNNTGAILLSQGNSLNEAEENLTAAFEMRKELLKETHPALANSYSNLGMLKKHMRDFVTAAEFYRKALDIRRKCLGPTHPDLAVSYNNLAVLCKTVGDVDNALRFYLKALDIKKSAFGEEHILLAGVHCNLGSLYRKRRRHREAVNHFSAALDIRKRTHGRLHVSVAKVKRQIAQVRREQEAHAEAIEMLRNSYNILKECPATAENHLQAAMTLSEWGATLYVDGQYEEAAKKFKESVDIRVKYTSQFTADVAVLYMNMGFALTKGKFYPQAAECFKNAAQIRGMILGKEHRETVEAELQAAAVRTAIDNSDTKAKRGSGSCYQM